MMWIQEKLDAIGVKSQKDNGQLNFAGVAEVICIVQLDVLRLQSTKLTLLLHFAQFQSYG